MGCEDCMAVSPDKPHFPFHRHRAAPHQVVMLRINLVRMSRCNRYGGESDRLYSSLMLIVSLGGAVRQTLGCDSHHWSPNSSLTRGRAWSQSLHPTTSRLVASLPCGMSLAFLMLVRITSSHLVHRHAHMRRERKQERKKGWMEGKIKQSKQGKEGKTRWRKKRGRKGK